MKKSIVFFVALLISLFLLNTNLFSRTNAYPPQGAVDVVPNEFVALEVEEEGQKDLDPVSSSNGILSFDFGSIKLKSAGRGKCTGITLVPKIGDSINVRAQRFTKSFWGSAPRPGKILSKWTELDPGGMRVKFDRAGWGQDYYKIFCGVQSGTGMRRVDCRDVLVIQDPKPGHCWSGPGSTDASFTPLNMTIKNK